MGFVVVVLILMVTMYGLIGWRLLAGVSLSTTKRRWVWAVLACAALVQPLAFTIRFLEVPQGLSDAVAGVSFFVLGGSIVTFCALAARDVVWLVLWLHRRWTSSRGGAVIPGRRRALLGGLNLGVGSVVAGATAYGYADARRLARVVEVDVPIANLPASLDGFRIAQISDIHVGPTIKRGYLQAIVERVNTLSPDLVAVTGDLVDGSVRHIGADVAPLAQLRARHGTFFVTGNHEYYSGASSWVRHLSRLGVRVLLNAHAVIEHDGGRVLVAGVTDHGAGHRVAGHASDPQKSVDGAPDADVRLLLAHQPRSLFKARQVKVGPSGRPFHLQLSGHTHGGQFFPVNFLVGLAHPVVEGLAGFSARGERLWVYVNRGTGYWGPPLRLGVPSEITQLRLRRA